MINYLKVHKIEIWATRIFQKDKFFYTYLPCFRDKQCFQVKIFVIKSCYFDFDFDENEIPEIVSFWVK